MSTPAPELALVSNRPLDMVLEEMEEAKAREKEAKAAVLALFDEIMDHSEIGVLSSTGTNTINESLKIATGVSRSWRQAKLSEISKQVDVKFWPFKTEYKEDVKKYKVVTEQFPDLATLFETALTTKPKKPTLTIKLPE